MGVVFGATPSQMSMLSFLHNIHSAGGWALLIESGLEGSAQEWKIKVSQEVQDLCLSNLEFQECFCNVVNPQNCQNQISHKYQLITSHLQVQKITPLGANIIRFWLLIGA